jgi:serine/threonine protein kinase
MTGEPSDDLPDGTIVGAFTVDTFLAEGGMGKVYRATGPSGERVALKFVKASLASNPTFRRRFYREARIAQTVRHPNVVPVLGTGEYGELPYMTQRFIDGISLEALLKRDGRLDVQRAVQICSDIASALDALWKAGAVHRDVKPGNVLLDKQGQAHITDLGLAKEIRGSVLTLPGQALGSMDYMAPEQIRGETVSAATDVYALGCVMYECLCGHPPFASLQGMRVLWAHLQNPPPDPCAARRDLPPEIAHTLLLALEKDPEKRPQSAERYALLLARAVASSSPPAPYPQRTE